MKPPQHDEIAAAIDARASKRARRAMTAHIESGVWALKQLRELNPPTNEESVADALDKGHAGPGARVASKSGT